ncbi:MAG: diphthine synthase [Candidatus Aenigmatarchaeota archaeon]
MLILAGLGISDEKGITLEELEEAKKADLIFIELYTSIWLGSLENLSNIVGKEIKLLKRKDLEDNLEYLLELAKNKNVLIFVPGDPLIATTHSSLMLESKKRGIEFKIYHNSSIFSAICETGLHIYKFGPTITIPLKNRGENFLSILQKIRENKRRGLHTLCLLDIDLEKNEKLSVKEAIDFLLENKAISEDEEILVVSCLGSKKQRIVYNKAKNLKEIDFELPAALVLPGELHFSEREILSFFK